MINLLTTNGKLKKSKDFCLIGLKGKVKEESSERDHLFPYATVTKSNVNVRTWLKMLRSAQAIIGRRGRLAITFWDGKILTSGCLDRILHFLSN